MPWRRAASCIAAGAATLVAACNPVEYAQYRRLAAVERDPVPLLYWRPLTVEYVWGRQRTVIYSDQGFSRMEQGAPPYTAHGVVDPREGMTYYWTDFGPRKGLLERRPAPKALYARARRWYGLERAQRLGGCNFAGETGRWYRYMRPPSFKGWWRAYTQACITDDGVLLAEGVYSTQLDPKSGGFRQAVRVDRGPLPEWVHEIPGRVTAYKVR